MDVEDLASDAGRIIELAGVSAILIGAVVATALFLVAIVGRRGGDHYGDYRRRLGRSILLGLEFLVAGDIIRTVAVDPTFSSVGVLAIIVAIRTFLSVSLQAEIEGRPPWRRAVPSRGDVS